MRLVVPALGEQWAQRTVDHARSQRRLLSRASLTLEERAGDLSGGVHPLLDVDGQRQEIHIALSACCCCRENHRVALADDHCAGGLLGHPAGLERDLATCNLHGDPCNGVATHIELPSLSTRRSAEPFSFILVSERVELSGPKSLSSYSGRPGRMRP